MQAVLSQKAGSSGPDVTAWQNLLTAAGFDTPATGVFDEATDASTRAWQAAKGLGVDGVVGSASWSKMTGATPIKSQYAKDAAFGRQVLQNIWQQVTGETPTLAQLQIAQGHAQLESGYGKFQFVNKTIPAGEPGHSSGVINNWGAVQAHGDQPGFLASDSGAAGAYTAHYRIYDTPEEGASDMVKELVLRRPTSWARAREGDIDAWALGAWNGTLPDGTINKDPATGVRGYFEQAPNLRALGVDERIAAIADALGEPIAAKRGGPMPVGDRDPPVPDAGLTAAGAGVSAAIFAAMAGAAAWYFRKLWWPW